VGVQAAPNHVGYEHFQLQLQGLHAMTMLQWETVDPKATHPRYRAVSGNNEFRVFCDAASSGSQNRPWILVVREIGEDGVHTHVFPQALLHGRRSEGSRSALERPATEVTGGTGAIWFPLASPAPVS
jgi:hypothetical protein